MPAAGEPSARATVPATLPSAPRMSVTGRSSPGRVRSIFALAREPSCALTATISRCMPMGTSTRWKAPVPSVVVRLSPPPTVAPATPWPEGSSTTPCTAPSPPKIFTLTSAVPPAASTTSPSPSWSAAWSRACTRSAPATTSANEKLPSAAVLARATAQSLPAASGQPTPSWLLGR